jgi:acyl carrier protein
MSTRISAENVISVIRTASIPGAATQAIDPDATFYEQGIDSLDALTIMLRIEESFQVPIPDDAVDRLDSVRSLVDYINGYRSQQNGGATAVQGSGHS